MKPSHHLRSCDLHHFECAGGILGDAGSDRRVPMDENPMAENIVAARRHHAPRLIRIFLLVGIIAAIASAAVLAGPPSHDNGGGAWPTRVTQLIGGPRSGNGFADVVDAVKPAVVGVQTKRAASPEELAHLGATAAGRTVTSLGSAFFISADGYAVTNNHVVEGSTTVTIETDDQKNYTAKIVGTDPTSDLALLKVDGRNDFPFVRFADKTPRIGDWVVAVGNPFGLGGTVTAGIVSARGRNLGAVTADNLIQIDAPINKGDSGGPTFDLNGRVIGVNMMIFSPSGGSVGIAFAVPADTLRMVIPQLRDKGTVTRGWLGVQIQSVTPDIAGVLGLKEAHGALVAGAQTNSPAERAGLASGDIIVSVDGAPIKDARDLNKMITSIAPGTTVEIGVSRGGAQKTMTAALDEFPVKRPAPAAGKPPETTGLGNTPTGRGSVSDHLGLKLAPAAHLPGADGVVVTEIDPTGLGADQGFELGDIILDVSGNAVTTPDEIERVLNDARSEGKPSVLMRLKSGDTLRFVVVPAAG
jgi:serine protease Do